MELLKEVLTDIISIVACVVNQLGSLAGCGVGVVGCRLSSCTPS